MFSCELCEISKNTFFQRTPLVAAFDMLANEFYLIYIMSQKLEKSAVSQRTATMVVRKLYNFFLFLCKNERKQMIGMNLKLYTLFYIRTNFTITMSLKMVKNKNKLTTIRGS